MMPPGHRLVAQDAVVARFNRVCGAVALAWLGIVLPVSLLLRPTYQDLSGLYIGPLVARVGAWGALYPVPSPDPRYYAGEAGQSQQKPALLQIAQEHGVDELNPYLNPPWQAVALLPLGWLTFQQAHWALVSANILCAWRVAVAAGRSYARCAGRPSYAAGWITLLVACSPLVYRSIRVQNLSPLVAFCIAVAVSDLFRPPGRSGFRGGSAMALGGLIKLATGALIPVAVFQRRWRLLGWGAGLSVLVILVTWNLAGAATFREFFGSIAPTLGRSSTNPGNKSLQGFLVRATGQSPLPRWMAAGFEMLRWGSLLLILWTLYRRGKRDGAQRSDPDAVGISDPGTSLGRHAPPVSSASSPSALFAAAVALVSWLLIFSPLCWEHYLIYLCPFWGWLIREGMRTRPRLIAASAAIALHWFPLPTLRWLTVREPLNSYMLAGSILMLTLALLRLRDRNDPSADTTRR